VVAAPTSSYNNLSFANIRGIWEKWGKIEQQNAAVQDEVTDFVNGSYSAVQAGEISGSDLVDPYLGVRNYDPTEDGETWSIRALTSLGLTPPSNVSDIGEMYVEADGTNLSGVLMSDGVPANNGTIELNRNIVNTDERTPEAIVIEPVNVSGTPQVGNVTVYLQGPRPFEFNVSYNATTGKVPTSIDTGTEGVRLVFEAENGLGTPSVKVRYNDGTKTEIVDADPLANGSGTTGFRVGETYDPANIPGPQFVVGENGTQTEITEPFRITGGTLDGARLVPGETVEYPEINYSTADLDGFKKLSQQLDALQAELDARQQQTRAGGGGAILGGLSGFSLFGISGLPALLIVLVGILLLIRLADSR
jgi:hypothetical protein